MPAPDFAAARAALSPVPTGCCWISISAGRQPNVDRRAGRSPAAAVDAGTRARLAETQGILILRRLRAEGIVTPAVLFADLDDDAQAEFLRRTLAPLTLAPSRLGLRELAKLLRGH